MIDLSRLFDSYNRQARLYPALIVILPPLLTILARYPALLTSNVVTTLLMFVISCGFLYLLTIFARSRGKSLERRLLHKWGGWPTTLWLRHNDDHLPRQTKARYHLALANHVPGLRLLSAEEEQADPVSADDAYKSAVEWLKEQCRGKPLVEKENAEYGFRRNLRGLRSFGVASATFGLLLSAAWMLRFAGITLAGLIAIDPGVIVEKLVQSSPEPLWGGALVNVIAIWFWIFVVRDAWVHQAGDQYARALLSHCDVLTP